MHILCLLVRGKSLKKSFYFIVAFVMQVMFFANVSYAVSSYQDLFVVKNIPVSQISYSSSEAKKLALNSARDKAFNTVLQRLLVSSDISKVVEPDNYNMEKFIQALKLNNEKTTSTSYSAVVDVQVNKNLILDYLKNQGLKVLSDVPPTTVLIFKGDTLFDVSNLDNDYNVVKFYKYNSNIYFDADNAGLDSFKGILSSYNANNVIVVDVKSVGGSSYSVSFKDKLLNIDGSFKTTDDNFVRDLIFKINDAYKMATDEGDFGKSVSMIIPISGLSDWSFIEKTISKISSIKSFEVQALKYNKAQLKLKYNYDLNSVVNELRRVGLDVQNKNTYLIVKR